MHATLIYRICLELTVLKSINNVVPWLKMIILHFTGHLSHFPWHENHMILAIMAQNVFMEFQPQGPTQHPRRYFAPQSLYNFYYS